MIIPTNRESFSISVKIIAILPYHLPYHIWTEALMQVLQSCVFWSISKRSTAMPRSVWCPADPDVSVDPQRPEQKTRCHTERTSFTWWSHSMCSGSPQPGASERGPPPPLMIHLPGGMSCLTHLTSSSCMCCSIRLDTTKNIFSYIPSSQLWLQELNVFLCMLQAMAQTQPD